MDALIRAADAALRCSAAPAMALNHLVDEVRAATGTTTLDPHRLLDGLRQHPDRFKILEPGNGPWRFLTGSMSASPASEPWVVSLGDPESPAEDGGARRIERRLRESLRRVSASVDASSPREVTRWYALVLAGQAAAQALREEKAA